jgi:hypothetical protein
MTKGIICCCKGYKFPHRFKSGTCTKVLVPQHQDEYHERLDLEEQDRADPYCVYDRRSEE